MELDIQSLREKLFPVLEALQQQNVHIDAVILFGSRAKKTHQPDSDVDLAFVSIDFGRDRISEGALLAKALFNKVPNCDPVPVSLREFMDPSPISPIVAEIKDHGIAVI